MLWKSGEKAQALSTLERFIKLHPTSAALDYALYLQGLVNFNDNLGLLGNLASQDLSERDQQASRDAYQSFRQLVEQFPQSTYAEDARLRMNYIVNSLAAYEVHVARYYLRRGAYVAAANRAQQAVQEFQQLAVDRRGADHPGPELRPARPDAASRRRRAHPEDELTRARRSTPTSSATGSRPGGSSGEPRLALDQPPTASSPSQAIASRSSSIRVIGGKAANRRRP